DRRLRQWRRRGAAVRGVPLHQCGSLDRSRPPPRRRVDRTGRAHAPASQWDRLGRKRPARRARPPRYRAPGARRPATLSAPGVRRAAVLRDLLAPASICYIVALATVVQAITALRLRRPKPYGIDLQEHS